LLESLYAPKKSRCRWVQIRPRCLQERDLHGHAGIVSLANSGEGVGQLVDRADERRRAD